MFHLDPRRCRQLTYGVGRSQRVLDRSQMRQYADLKTALLASWGREGTLSRLVDYAHSLPRAFGDGFDPELLQDNDPRRELQRAHRFRAAFQIAIEIGAGQSDDERGKRMLLPETLNRRKAALRVQRDQQVTFFPIPAFLDADLVP